MQEAQIARRGRRAAAAALLLAAPLYACMREGPPAPYVVGERAPFVAAAEPGYAPTPRSASAPAEITVRRGDTLDSIVHAYHVPRRALIAANGLHPPYRVEPGWTLVIPRGGSAASRVAVAALPAAPPPRSAAPAPLPAPPTRAVASAAPPPAVPMAPRPPEKPSFAAAEPAAPAAASGGEAPAARPLAPPPKQVASLSPAKPAPETEPPPPAAPGPREGGFLWPVRGQILAGYGVGADGTHNDGINIAAPRGAPVQATETGVVVYAGNELRGYGNLILVKHAGGWISAYAHCDLILVKRGQQVHRGQIIARVGSTGNVSAPQLHFELRRGDKPVDPKTLLAPLSTATAPHPGPLPARGEREGPA